MKLEPFNHNDIDELYNFIVDTIQTSYFGYYPEEAITYFIEYSNKQGILEDAQHNHVIVVKDNNKIIGTGTLKYTHIQRVFVSPYYQGKGVGKLIMHDLEHKAVLNQLKLVELHSSLFAKRFYDSVGYKMFKIGKVEVENGELLYFQRMAKRLNENQDSTHYNFHKKQFKVVENDGIDIEVNLETSFRFYQNETLVYAEYTGGEVTYGEMFGLIENHTIDFYFSQINLVGGKNQGKFNNKISIVDNKIQLVGWLEWEHKKEIETLVLQEV